MADDTKKVHNLAVKQAVQAYLDFWLSAEHVDPDKELVDATIGKLHELELT